MAFPKIIQIPEGDEGALQYHYKRTEVSSAQILTLNSAPLELVEAPGAGYVLSPMEMIIDYQFETIAYATNTRLQLINDSADVYMNDDGPLPSIIDYISIGSVPLFPTPAHENESLRLTVNTGDPTAGDGTLTIHLWYIKLLL